MTVSRALNNRSNVDKNTRKRVLDTAKRMGYKPNHIARSLTTKRTFTIGVVLPKMSHSFFPDAIRGIEEVAYQKDYQLILTHSSENAIRETKVIESLVSKRVDGILISSAQNVKDLKHYKELLESNYPVVFFDRWIPGLSASSVRTNDEECAWLITKHLIERHGYQKIAHISGPENVSIGAIRNNNSRLFRELGPDTGLDSMGDFPQSRSLSKFLDRLDSGDQLTKTILYNVNPIDNALFATMIGNFQDGSVAGKMQFGSAWWFLDQKDGIEGQLRTLANMSLLSQFVGMLTDSRSFLSYPRHEYFRRVLCNMLGSDIEKGLIPADTEFVGSMVRDICYHNAENYFDF